ncbi:MAG: hypothetical protein ACXWZF_11280 [Actinomycetota bacterium]
MRAPRLMLVIAIALCVVGASAMTAVAKTPERRILDRTLGRGSADRGTAGETSTYLTSRPFTVDGSPYEWTIEVSQSDPGPGSPPNDPNMRIIASRRAATGSHPMQAHIWEFDLAAGSLGFNDELRQVSLDTGLIPAYGAIFMDLEDLRAMRTSKDRCPRTDDVLSTRSIRRGVLRGSMTFFPGYADPQLPDEVNITHVRATIKRTRYTGNDCPFGNPCDPGKVLTGNQPTGGGGYLIAAGLEGRDRVFLFQGFETVGAANIVHFVVAIADEPALFLTPTSAEVSGDIAAPFFTPGGSMSWTKGTKDVDVGPRCRRTSWQLITPTGSLEARLDSGDQTLAAPTTAGLEIEARR